MFRIVIISSIFLIFFKGSGMVSSSSNPSEQLSILRDSKNSIFSQTLPSRRQNHLIKSPKHLAKNQNLLATQSPMRSSNSVTKTILRNPVPKVGSHNPRTNPKDHPKIQQAMTTEKYPSSTAKPILFDLATNTPTHRSKSSVPNQKVIGVTDSISPTSDKNRNHISVIPPTIADLNKTPKQGHVLNQPTFVVPAVGSKLNSKPEVPINPRKRITGKGQFQLTPEPCPVFPEPTSTTQTYFPTPKPTRNHPKSVTSVHDFKPTLEPCPEFPTKGKSTPFTESLPTPTPTIANNPFDSVDNFDSTQEPCPVLPEATSSSQQRDYVPTPAPTANSITRFSTTKKNHSNNLKSSKPSISTTNLPIIVFLCLAVVACILGYSILKRGKQKEFLVDPELVTPREANGGSSNDALFTVNQV